MSQIEYKHKLYGKLGTVAAMGFGMFGAKKLGYDIIGQGEGNLGNQLEAWGSFLTIAAIPLIRALIAVFNDPVFRSNTFGNPSDWFRGLKG